MWSLMASEVEAFQQLGAGVARGAHNPEVPGSKPGVASW